MLFYILDVDANAAHRYMVPSDYDTSAHSSQARLSRESLPDYEPVFSDLLIGEDYTDEFFLTDFLVDGAIMGQGFTVSEKVKTVLQDFALCEHRYYPLRSFRINEDTPPTPLPDVQYYYLQLVATPYYHWIDYNTSTFYGTHDVTGEHHPLVVPDAQALTAAIAETGRGYKVCFEQLTLNKEYSAIGLDLFFFHRLGYAHRLHDTIMTSRLQQALQRAGVTGMTFPEPINIRLSARMA